MPDVKSCSMILRSESRLIWRDTSASMPASVRTSFGERRRHTAILNFAGMVLNCAFLCSSSFSSSETTNSADLLLSHNSRNESTQTHSKPNDVKCATNT